MAKSIRRAGQINLRGKKTARLLCGCCCCRDLRSGIMEKMVKREIRDAMREMQKQVDEVTGRNDWI